MGEVGTQGCWCVPQRHVSTQGCLGGGVSVWLDGPPRVPRCPLPRPPSPLTLLLAVQTKVTSAPGFTRCTRFSSTVTVMALPGVSAPRRES